MDPTQLPPPAPAPNPAPTPTPQHPLQQAPRKSSRTWMWIILGAMSLLVVLGITGALLFIKPAKTPQPTTGNIDSSSLGASYDSLYVNGIKEFTPANKDATLTTYAELTKGFQVKPAFLQDTTNGLISLGIASLATNASTGDKEAYRYELYLLAKPYMTSKPADIVDEAAETVTDEQAKAVYAKFTDAALTQKVRDAVANRNLVTMQNAKLKLSPEAAKPVEIHVLGFDEKSGQEKIFASELKETGWIPPLWNDKRDTFNYIVFSKTEAEHFLDTTQSDANALFLHEYTHSQPEYSRGSNLGLALEERRAEYFSGDKGAYYDVKQFFIYLNVFTGFNVVSEYDQFPTNAQSFYTTMYKTLGVSLANKVFATNPNIYLQDSSTPVKKVQALTGGYNGNLEEAYKLGQQNQLALKDRMTARAKKLIDLKGSKAGAIQDLQDYTANIYKLEFAAQKMIEYINTTF